jgi:hypothetical protein
LLDQGWRPSTPRCEFALVHRLEQVSVSIAFEQ